MSEPVIKHGGMQLTFEPSEMGCTESVIIKCPTGEVLRIWAYGNDSDRPIVYQWDSVEEFEDGTEAKLQLDVPRRLNLIEVIDMNDSSYHIEKFSDVFYVHFTMKGKTPADDANSPFPEFLTHREALAFIAADITKRLTEG